MLRYRRNVQQVCVNTTCSNQLLLSCSCEGRDHGDVLLWEKRGAKIYEDGVALCTGQENQRGNLDEDT
jgi:hypothetical protein